MTRHRLQRPSSIENLNLLLTDDGSQTLFDSRLQEAYHSGAGAVTETWHAYVVNSKILEFSSASKTPLRVLEYGFGTGLGFFLTAASLPENSAPLHYVALERWLLPVSVLQELELIRGFQSAMDQEWQGNFLSRATELVRQFLDWRSSIEERDSHGLRSFRPTPTIHLDLVLGEAATYGSEKESFDSVYFDAFSPKTNPDLWTVDVLSRVRGMLKEGKTLVTYCVSGEVRRMLEGVGFHVERLPGPPGGKREVLRAIRSSINVADGANFKS